MYVKKIFRLVSKFKYKNFKPSKLNLKLYVIKLVFLIISFLFALILKYKQISILK